MVITSISKVQTNLSHLRGLLEHLCCKYANRKPANFDDFDHVITFDDHFDRNYHMREQKYGSQEKICLVLDCSKTDILHNVFNKLFHHHHLGFFGKAMIY